MHGDDEHSPLAALSRSAAIAQWFGRIAGPLLAIFIYSTLPSVALGPDAQPTPETAHNLTDAGRAVAAIGVLMAILWMTEALPLPATSLLPLVLFPLTGVATIGQAAAPYADRVIFLFMGGFMLALAMEKWGLHKRIALCVILLVGTRPARIVGGFIAATALISMWMSNTATAAMMMPIGLSVIGLTAGRLTDEPKGRGDATHFAAALMLAIAYAASIGGMGTPFGTPPNLILTGYLETTHNIDITVAQWLAFGAPLVLVFSFLCWVLLTKLVHPVRAKDIPGGRELIRGELRLLGPVSRGEWTVLVVFLFTALAWILREPLTNWQWLIDRAPFITALDRLDDAGIAMLAALLLFAIPVDARRAVFALDWRTASRLPWGVLLLFGGGLSLAAAMKPAGLEAWFGHQVAGLASAPVLAVILCVAIVIMLLSELASNTATAAAFLPIVAGIAVGAGVDPVLLLVPAALAASCGFMLPVATPPNAIVFGTGRVTMMQMIRAGALLDLIGVALITAAAFTVVRWALG